MKEPLAFRLRPHHFTDVIGQQHLVSQQGILPRFVKAERAFSLIFYGPPGVGKTSLALILAEELKRPYKFFNAVTGNKKDLDAIFVQAKLAPPLLLICDEVHRLNKDKQDLLLPHLEDGSIILLGATTANPYHAINPAIRSRCHLLECKALQEEDILQALKRALQHPEGLNGEYQISEEALQQIAKTAGGDIRYALNLLEIVALAAGEDKIISLASVQENTRFAAADFGSEDNHYDLLSAFQKSIRGSDVNAALYYLAALAQSGDVEGILRRLQVIAYEDIGLANPALASRSFSVCQTAREIGFPEAIIPLGMYIIELCLSAKSRTAVDATQQAVKLVSKQVYPVPDYLRYTPVGLRPEQQYHYDRYDVFHKIRYLPKELANIEFINHFGNNRYEQLLKASYEELKKFTRSANLETLYKNK